MEKKDFSLRERFCVWTIRNPWTTLCASTLVGMGAGYAFRNLGKCKCCSVAKNIVGGGCCGAMTGFCIVGWSLQTSKPLILKVVNPQEQRELEKAECAFFELNDQDCSKGFADWKRLKEFEYKRSVALGSYRDMSLRERIAAAYDLSTKHSGYQNGHNGRHLERIIAVFEQQFKKQGQLAAERELFNHLNT